MQTVRGFSIVELMITVAIVGIAASIAVPNYRSYVEKNIVAAGADFAIEPQIEIAEKVRTGRTLPSNNYRFYEDNSSDAEVSYVHWYSDSSYGGRIVVNYGPNAGSRLKNKRLWFVLDNSNPRMVKWTCMSHPFSGLAVPVDSLPKNCQ